MCPRLNCKKSLEDAMKVEQQADPSRTCDRCGARLSSKYGLKRHVSIISEGRFVVPIIYLPYVYYYPLSHRLPLFLFHRHYFSLTSSRSFSQSIPSPDLFLPHLALYLFLFSFFFLYQFYLSPFPTASASFVISIFLISI